MLKYIYFNSLIGEIGIVWDSNLELLKQVILPETKTRRQNPGQIRYNGVIAESNPSEFVYELMSDIKDIVLGKEISFSLNRLDLSDLTEFQREVLINQAKIPHAHVTTYKHLAEMVGKPKSARPVANVLSNNIFPLVIPCHRTVRSDWTIGGYAGTNDSKIKEFLLSNEGVLLEKGIINRQFRYFPDNEDMIV